MSERYHFQSKLVQHCRQRVGLSSAEVARRLGRAYQQINNIENGYKGIPAEIALKWSEVLEIPPLKLVKAVVTDFQRDYVRRMHGMKETTDVSET